MERTIRSYGRKKETSKEQDIGSTQLEQSHLQLTPKSRIKALLIDDEFDDSESKSFSTSSFKDRLDRLKAINTEESEDLISSVKNHQSENVSKLSDREHSRLDNRSSGWKTSLLEPQHDYQQVPSCINSVEPDGISKIDSVKEQNSYSKLPQDSDDTSEVEKDNSNSRTFSLVKSLQSSNSKVSPKSIKFDGHYNNSISSDICNDINNSTAAIAPDSPNNLETDEPSSPNIKFLNTNNNKENIFLDWDSPSKRKQGPKIIVNSDEEDIDEPDPIPVYQSQVKAKPVSF